MRDRMLALAAALAMMLPAQAMAGWHRGYVVDWYSQSGWSGGDKDVNCSNGALAYLDPIALLKTAWRTPAEMERLTAPGAIGFGTPLRDRGPQRGQNVYRDPTLVADPGPWSAAPTIGPIRRARATSTSRPSSPWRRPRLS